MRSNNFLSAAAIVGLAAASPAPQQLDFALLAAAPAVQTAPVLNGISNHTVTIVETAIAASISAAVSTTATAISTIAPAAKRDLEKRTYSSYPYSVGIMCSWFGMGCPSDYWTWGQTTSSSSAVKTSSSSSSAAVKTSSSSSSSSAAVKTSSSSSSSSSSFSSVQVSSAVAVISTSASSTVGTSSGTSTVSSTTACPTTPEDGTYCGFINPEDPCAPQPDGYGPKVTPDTTDAFLAYAPFHSMATNAPLSVPRNNTGSAVITNGYLQTFRDLNATSSANSYMGLHTLSSYDVAGCAALCDAETLCTAFNIYIERDPSQNPCKNDSTDPTVWGYWCPNPTSITNFKCTLWGSNLDASSATNQGGYRGDFAVVVTASNGYDATNVTFPPLIVDPVDNTATSASSVASSAPTFSSVKSSSVATSTASSTKTSSVAGPATAGPSAPAGPAGGPPAPPAPVKAGPTWGAPTNCNKKAINAPNYWMGSKFFPGPYNPQVCSDFAVYQHALNKRSAIAAGKSTFTPCNSFNAYYIHKNGVPHGTYCALYDVSISVSYATYTGGYSGQDKFDCKQSYHYTRNVQDSGRC